MEKGIGGLRTKRFGRMPSAFVGRQREDISERAKDRLIDQQVRDYMLRNQRFTDPELRRLSQRDLEYLRSRGSDSIKQRVNKIITERKEAIGRANFLASPSADIGEMAMERNLMQQEQLGFAAGKEVDVDALPKGLKAMYDSGPKGREGVEKIAAKTDKFAEGGAVENEIDEALSEIQSVQPEAMVIQQVMTMVMEMIQSGASEEQIMQALMKMGLDQEDIQQVMMMVAEEMAGQDSIDGQLAQMM